MGSYIGGISFYDNGRNLKQREALVAAAHKLEDQCHAAEQTLDDAVPDNCTDAEFDELMVKTKSTHDHYSAQYMALYHKARQLESPEVRNAWFCQFVASFPEGKSHISRKQGDIFARYCVDDDDSWRSHQRYCRAGGRYIVYDSLAGYVEIEKA